MESDKWEPQPTQFATEPYGLFLRESYQLAEFLVFITKLAAETDHGAVILAEALLKYGSPNEEQRAEYHKTILEKGSGTLKKLQSFDQLLLQTTLCRAVDNFLLYLAQLLSLVFRTKPETLRSSDQIKVDFALQFKTMDELVDALAEKKVTELSYAGMRELSEYLNGRLQLELFDNDKSFEHAVFLVEVRNLIVHNRAVVNNIFLHKLRGINENTGTIGEALELNREHVLDDLLFTLNTVGNIESRAVSKFSLPQPHPMGRPGQVFFLRRAER